MRTMEINTKDERKEIVY